MARFACHSRAVHAISVRVCNTLALHSSSFTYTRCSFCLTYHQSKYLLTLSISFHLITSGTIDETINHSILFIFNSVEIEKYPLTFLSALNYLKTAVVKANWIMEVLVCDYAHKQKLGDDCTCRKAILWYELRRAKPLDQEEAQTGRSYRANHDDSTIEVTSSAEMLSETAA
ncbi:hypothetical protein X798_04347 [Onchocerca flexuosa]|uniref:Uncharacterized protein n=1 Tax=Onchocerca flexuosa TaxID=387005 RepID=A0A238BUT1_9BILA|nr:hypothetical protein X798_04347 [Onchocerca flexuosa]